ncbi:hypothetical protein CORC01_11183 [Colletotrichum orchidophilum]|uniref:Bromo domain-containing protein n=1 Tax=Colletotrichum orchidophilum TaxID=1209926 RepID=A0A1G4AWI4_9PEZI|nr:uncharacterized protein CORC01_11183 [Colletotrichum orchidophilum]OHE93497.1 hypothetical protein CORC01_11183 [Colletotrichum orchidophilum]
MDNKRRSSAVNGANEADERAAKRQRLTEKYDLSKQETVESTTEHGHFFLEQIRRTADKNGRKVAGYFEKLPPRENNPDYYKKTRMPISLSIIERKLTNGDFSTLTELESYFKRMVSNAKEFYPRNTQQFDDAERVRKALSNFMTKTNPAYARGGYAAVPTPLPANRVDEAEEDDEEDAPSNPGRRKSQVIAKSTEEQGDADGDEDEEEEEAEADEDDEEEDDDAEGEEDDDEGSQNSKPTILIRRRGPGRPSKGATPRKSKARMVTPSRPDYEYEGVPYKGLNFQTAQEKIVEEMIRQKEDGEAEAYFEPFVNLPPRVLKDYYRIVKEPMSLRKLQKITKGVRGRNEATGSSDLKSWAAFEETASLLWKNAFFYNEEGSEIYELAQELQDFFADELKQAKAAVPEPSQPKIKLKVQQPAIEQPTASKKITIHVGGKSESADSPAPAISQSAGVLINDQAPLANGTARQVGLPAVSAAMDRLRSTSAASPSPSVANNIKREDATRPSPVVTPGQPSTPSAFQPPASQTTNLSSATFQPIGVVQPQPQANATPQPPPKPLWDQQFRAPGKSVADALISNLTVQTHPMINAGGRFEITLLPLERECKQSMTVHLPAGQLRIQIIATMPTFLEKDERQWRLYVSVNRQVVHQFHPIQGQVLPVNARVFDVQLQAGTVNEIEVSVAAALPKGQKLPSGADFEEFSDTTIQAVPAGGLLGANNIYGNQAGFQAIDQVRWRSYQANDGIPTPNLRAPPVTLQDVWDQAKLRSATTVSVANALGFREYTTDDGLVTFYPPIPSWPEDDQMSLHLPTPQPPAATTLNHRDHDPRAPSPRVESRLYPRLQNLLSEGTDHTPLPSDSAQYQSPTAFQSMDHRANQITMGPPPTRDLLAADARLRQQIDQRHFRDAEQMGFARNTHSQNCQQEASHHQVPHATQRVLDSQAASRFYDHLPQRLGLVHTDLPGEQLRQQLQLEQMGKRSNFQDDQRKQTREYLQYRQSPYPSQQRTESDARQEDAITSLQKAQNAAMGNRMEKVKQEVRQLGGFQGQHYMRNLVALVEEDYKLMGACVEVEMKTIEQREKDAGQPKLVGPARKGDLDGEYIWSV